MVSPQLELSTKTIQLESLTILYQGKAFSFCLEISPFHNSKIS